MKGVNCVNFQQGLVVQYKRKRSKMILLAAVNYLRNYRCGCHGDDI